MRRWRDDKSTFNYVILLAILVLSSANLLLMSNGSREFNILTLALEVSCVLGAIILIQAKPNHSYNKRTIGQRKSLKLSRRVYENGVVLVVFASCLSSLISMWIGAINYNWLTLTLNVLCVVAVVLYLGLDIYFHHLRSKVAAPPIQEALALIEDESEVERNEMWQEALDEFDGDPRKREVE